MYGLDISNLHLCFHFVLSLLILVGFGFGLVIGHSFVVLIKGLPLHIQLHAQISPTRTTEFSHRTTAFCQVQTGWCVVADVVEVIGHIFVQRLAGPKTIQQLMVSLQAGETGRFGYYSNPHVWAHPRWSFLITLGSGQANNLEAPATEETRSMAAMDDGFASSQHEGPLSAKLSFAGFWFLAWFDHLMPEDSQQALEGWLAWVAPGIGPEAY